jgi:Protein of unknown function (DUF3592)
VSQNALRFLACLFVGLLLLLRGIDAFRNSASAKGWPTTEAVVTESATGWVAHPRALHRPIWSYALDIRYRYTWHGRTFTGSRVRFSVWGPTEDFNPLMELLAHRYPAGKQTVAYVDPRDPSRSVLDRSAAGSNWAAVVGGIALMAVGGRQTRRTETGTRTPQTSSPARLG